MLIGLHDNLSEVKRSAIHKGAHDEHEYHEGPEILEKFNKTVEQLFRVPKSAIKPKPTRQPKAISKTK